MSDEIQQQILSRIDALSEKLGVAADHLWPALVRYAMVKNAFFLLAWVVGAAIAIWAIRNRPKSEGYRDEVYVEALFPFGLAALIAILTLSGLFGLPEVVSGIFSPEIAALRELMP